jgi:hypothetical protein
VGEAHHRQHQRISGGLNGCDVFSLTQHNRPDVDPASIF